MDTSTYPHSLSLLTGICSPPIQAIVLTKTGSIMLAPWRCLRGETGSSPTRTTASCVSGRSRRRFREDESEYQERTAQRCGSRARQRARVGYSALGGVVGKGGTYLGCALAGRAHRGEPHRP